MSEEQHLFWRLLMHSKWPIIIIIIIADELCFSSLGRLALPRKVNQISHFHFTCQSVKPRGYANPITENDDWIFSPWHFSFAVDWPLKYPATTYVYNYTLFKSHNITSLLHHGSRINHILLRHRGAAAQSSTLPRASNHSVMAPARSENWKVPIKSPV